MIQAFFSRPGAKIFLIFIPVMIFTAWNSIGFHQLDEYAMVVEFASTKLGITQPETLSWEHRTQIRPWLQPALLVLTHKALAALAITDRFVVMFVFRTAHGLLTLLGLIALWGALPYLSLDPKILRRAPWFLCFGFFVPYLSIRPSSEMAAAAMLLFATAVFLRHCHTGDKDSGGWFFFSALAIGFFTGMAFQFRYQTAAATLGLLAHAVFFGKKRGVSALGYTLGFAITFSIGMALDIWGYGKATLAFWNYFDYNLIKGVAAQMGTKPFWAGFYISAQGPWAPLIGILMAGAYLFWFRFPKHPFTWITLPFWLLHAAIGHKEPRFLYPMAYHAMLMAFILASTPTQKQGPWFEPFFHRLAHFSWVKALRKSYPALVGLNLLAFGYFVISPVRNEIALQKVIYNTAKQAPQSQLWSVGLSPYQNVGEGGMFYYRPDHLTTLDFESLAKLPKEVPTSGPTFLSIFGQPDDLALANTLRGKDLEARLISRSFPIWVNRVNVGSWLERTRHWSLYLVTPQHDFVPSK